MQPTITRWARLFVVAVLLAGPAYAQEHPEHPEEGKAAGPALSKEQLAEAIRAHVEKAARDGWYTIEDPVQGKPIRLRLDEVHRERLARVAPDTYFACADFVSDDGVKYDLDFFMKGKDAAHLRFADVSIHKRNGVERYRWREEDGLWKKQPLEPTAGG